jgi:ABC-type sugar transport system ATPase subunit
MPNPGAGAPASQPALDDSRASSRRSKPPSVPFRPLFGLLLAALLLGCNKPADAPSSTPAAQRWIERLGIRCRAPAQRVLELSGGNQQKIALARLLHHDADVLLLDEPTRGIDVVAKAVCYQLINDLAAGSPAEGRAPKAVLVVSSYLPELLGICDRIAVMCRSRLGPAHPVSEVDEHALMLEATGQEIGPQLDEL